MEHRASNDMSVESFTGIDERVRAVRGFALSSPYGAGDSLGQPAGVKSIGFIELESESGIVGLGETYSGVYAPELIMPTVQYLSEFLVGKQIGDPQFVRDLSDLPFIGASGLIRSVISGIEIAAWDLRGKLLGIPSYRFFSAAAPHIRTYASGGSAAMTPDEIRSDAEKVAALGFDSYKMRVGFQDWPMDVRRVSAARGVLGESGLMVDAIMGTIRPAWSAEEAVRRAKELEQFRLRWLEEPVSPADISGLAAVRASTSIPIAAGEAYSGRIELDALIEANAIDVLQFDATHSGGISECINLAGAAHKHGLSSALHVWGSAAALAANACAAIGSSSEPELEIPMVSLEITERMWIQAPSLSGGLYRASDYPGLGVKLTEEMKEHYSLISGSGFKLPQRPK